jgi:SAM-dependent methyltransferase
MFEAIVWQEDRMLYSGLVFRFQHYKSESWELGDECFVFYKVKQLVSQYDHFFSSREFQCQRFFELGLWEGGSLPFWFEAFKPIKIVGIDLADKRDSGYFQRYVIQRDLQNRVKTYWRVNQADSHRLKQIVAEEFDDSLDLILDDASHVYDATLSSFQTLFQYLRPGGLYIIEDWAWEHWPDCTGPNSPLAQCKGLTDLISQMIEAVGTSEKLIKSVTVYQGFAVIERNAASIAPNFELANQIERRPKIAQRNPMINRIKRGIRRTIS